jgi:hypothetical protein
MEELLKLLDDVPLTVQQIMWSMHDAAPVHSTHDIKQFLESHYPH